MINQLILDADAALAANGNTTRRGPKRPGRLEKLFAWNNGGAVIPPSSCKFIKLAKKTLAFLRGMKLPASLGDD